MFFLKHPDNYSKEIADLRHIELGFVVGFAIIFMQFEAQNYKNVPKNQNILIF